MEQAWTRSVDFMGEQSEQMSNTSQREEILIRKRQEFIENENRLEERTDEHLTRNLPRVNGKLKKERNA